MSQRTLGDAKAQDRIDAIVSQCSDCGRDMTKAEGGEIFTVCSACWNKSPSDDFPFKPIVDVSQQAMSSVQRYRLQTHRPGVLGLLQDDAGDWVTYKDFHANQQAMQGLQAQLAQAEAKLNHNRCNAGHETLPLVLWDCPECTRLIKQRVDQLQAEINFLKSEGRMSGLITANQNLANERNRLQAEVQEHEASFNLRHGADMRAIKRWQEATGKTQVWPDHADLCVWLMESTERLQAELNESQVEIERNHNYWKTANDERVRLQAEVAALKAKNDELARLTGTHTLGSPIYRIADLEKQLADSQAEVERLKSDLKETDEQNERISKKLQLSHENCACDYEQEGDVCMSHFPAKEKLEKQLADQQAEIERLNHQVAVHKSEALYATDGQVMKQHEIEEEREKLRTLTHNFDSLFETHRNQQAEIERLKARIAELETDGGTK